MNAAEKYTYVSPEAYLAYDDSIDGKAEYYDGHIVDMAGGSENHSLICANMIIGVGSRIKGRPCRVYESNFKLELSENSKYIYPDLFVICGPTEKSKLRDDICTNPTITVEVLSDSTRSFDQGVKHFRYRMMPSLREFVTVEQDRPLVFVHYRNDAGQWLSDAYADLNDQVKLYSLDLSIPMAEIYANVVFPPEEEAGLYSM
jgi:Uma2 family endonuclease